MQLLLWRRLWRPFIIKTLERSQSWNLWVFPKSTLNVRCSPETLERAHNNFFSFIFQKHWKFAKENFYCATLHRYNSSSFTHPTVSLLRPLLPFSSMILLSHNGAQRKANDDDDNDINLIGSLCEWVSFTFKLDCYRLRCGSFTCGIKCTNANLNNVEIVSFNAACACRIFQGSLRYMWATLHATL